jgi:L-seryl-tRNA(Ser) seleniumtransferase
VSDPRRRIPRTDAVLADPRLAPALTTLGKTAVKAVVHAEQERARVGELPPEQVVDAVLARLPARATSLRPVLNATGVLVHTNLGRAPLSRAARDALDVAAGTTDVEFDLTTGTRARRGSGAIEALLAAVPNAEAVHVVNNNAAALLLCALALAQSREIVLGRGEFVEIGDGFRIPELLASTGARLREVGTTNRTRLADYRDAVHDATGFILKVHPSNFTISGFTSHVEVAELVGLGVPVVVDIGSGLVAPHPLLPDEPDAASMLRQGAALVTASADKLLGGPQAGLIFGSAELVERLRRHPAARALRVDKLTLAALEATVRGPAPPVIAALEASEDGLEKRARLLAERLAESGVPATPVRSHATVGGGGAPGVELPSWAVSLPEEYAPALRTGDPPVVARVAQDRCLLDLRTIDPSDDELLAKAVRTVAEHGGRAESVRDQKPSRRR